MAKNLSKAAKNLRVSLEKVDPKLTYSTGLQVKTKFVSKDFQPRINAGIAEGDRIIQTGLKAALDEAMDSSIWKWDPARVTLRANGSEVRSPRNIVDTGALKASYRSNIKNGNINIVYREPYARITNFGGYIIPYGNPNASKVYLPPRPWIQSVLNGENGIERYPIGEIYRKAITDQFR